MPNKVRTLLAKNKKHFGTYSKKCIYIHILHLKRLFQQHTHETTTIQDLRYKEMQKEIFSFEISYKTPKPNNL